MGKRSQYMAIGQTIRYFNPKTNLDIGRVKRTSHRRYYWEAYPKQRSWLRRFFGKVFREKARVIETKGVCNTEYSAYCAMQNALKKGR